MSTGITEEQLEDGYVYERIRMGDFEREIKGPADYVERRMNETFEFIVANRLQLAEMASHEPIMILPESDTPSLADDGVPQNYELQAENQAAQVSDLLTFYLKKSPQGQYQQVAVITYWYQKFNGADSHEVVTYDDYAAAYTLLKRASVEMPTDVKGSVRNTNNRTDYIFSPKPGEFAMTIQGEQFVEQLGVQA